MTLLAATALETVGALKNMTKHPVHIWPLLLHGSETFDAGFALGYKDYHSMVRKGDGYGYGASYGYGDGDDANGHGGGRGDGSVYGMQDGDGQG